MKKIATVTVFTACFAALAACSNDPQINAAVGGLTGAAVGTQIGSGSGRTAAILGGGAVGAATGAALTQPSPRRY